MTSRAQHTVLQNAASQHTAYFKTKEAKRKVQKKEAILTVPYLFLWNMPQMNM